MKVVHYVGLFFVACLVQWLEFVTYANSCIMIEPLEPRIGRTPSLAKLT